MRSGRLAITIAIVSLSACPDHGDRGAEVATPVATTEPPPPAAVRPPDPHVASRELAPCTDPVLHVETGVERGWLCPDAAAALGLTLVDLSERWAPLPFAGGDGLAPPKFRDTYLTLAAERDPEGGELADEERLVEMYGITPAWSVILRRYGEAKRHACHAGLDNTALASIKIRKPITEDDNASIEARDRQRRGLGRALEKERVRRKLPDVAALAKVKSQAKRYATWRKLQTQHEAIVVMQRHLVCEKLLGRKWVDGVFRWNTGNALELYQRSHFLMPDGKLDAETQAAMIGGSFELDFRAALRVLRERIVDATGLIEDGSAGTGPRPVLGRALEPAAMRVAKGHAPLANAAEDRIGAATEAAALALGWLHPGAAQAFLARHAGDALIVAMPLPAPPPYHTAHMELRAVLDRGDVWYDPLPRHRDPARRPALILYARVDGVELPLVRWPSTIGGWADQKLPSGRVRDEWKESDVGPRVWKELYVAPTWQPPKTTPDDELVKRLWPGVRLKTEVMGPGARSAYGMVMLINHEVRPRKKGKVRWNAYADHGIRVHGSSSVTSVIRGTSHGCHRLLNHLAVRLGSFLLRHRDHVRKGDQRTGYRRVIRAQGETFKARIDTRGYLYELTPPVPIEVTKGKIKSARKKPPKPHG